MSPLKENLNIYESLFKKSQALSSFIHKVGQAHDQYDAQYHKLHDELD